MQADTPVANYQKNHCPKKGAQSKQKIRVVWLAMCTLERTINPNLSGQSKKRAPSDSSKIFVIQANDHKFNYGLKQYFEKGILSSVIKSSSYAYES